MKSKITLIIVLFSTVYLNAQTCLLDSTLQYNSDSILNYSNHYFYNNDGLQTENFSQQLVSGVMTNNTRRTSSYDANENLIQYIDYIWNNGAWQNSGRVTYTYDANGNETSKTQEAWDNTTSQWLPTTFQIYNFYNALNQRYLYIQVGYSMGVWTDSVKQHYTYDVNGNNILITREYNTASDPTWVNHQQWTYTYTNNNLNDSIFQAIWDNGTASYSNYIYLTTYEYNASGKITETKGHNNYNAGTNTWTYQTRETKVYDAQDNEIERNTYNWSASNWEPSNQWQLSYNNDGINIEGVYYNFNSTFGQLVPSYKYEIELTSFDKTLNYISYSFNSLTSIWERTSNNFYFYDCMMSSIQEKDATSITVFPNPTSSLLFVNTDYPSIIEIYSINGKLMHYNFPHMNHTINVVDYPSGVYIVKVGNQIQKFIKE
jgi:hypothetical protein